MRKENLPLLLQVRIRVIDLDGDLHDLFTRFYIFLNIVKETMKTKIKIGS